MRRLGERKACVRRLRSLKPQAINELGAVKGQKALWGKLAGGLEPACGGAHLKSQQRQGGNKFKTRLDDRRRLLPAFVVGEAFEVCK